MSPATTRGRAATSTPCWSASTASPAFATIAYFYYTDAGTAATGGNLRGSNNYEARWKDQAKYQTLNSAYAKVGTIPKACQDDAFQPDACKIGAEVKQSTR